MSRSCLSSEKIRLVLQLGRTSLSNQGQQATTACGQSAFTTLAKLASSRVKNPIKSSRSCIGMFQSNLAGSLLSLAHPFRMGGFGRWRGQVATASRSYSTRYPSSLRWRSIDYTNVLWGIILANGGVYLLWKTDPYVAARHFVVSRESMTRRPWTVVTSCFSHADFGHLASNMITLYFFGSTIGSVFGGKKV